MLMMTFIWVNKTSIYYIYLSIYRIYLSYRIVFKLKLHISPSENIINVLTGFLMIILAMGA